MSVHSLSHLSDAVLLRDLANLVTRDRTTTTAILAHIAEADERRLYAPAGYPSMHAYCVGELHLSEDAAFKRIRAARAARKHPCLFAALADGRLHLAGVCLLATHLTHENVNDLVAAATHQSKAEIERLLAARFPQSEALALVEVMPPLEGPAHGITSRQAPGPVTNRDTTRFADFGDQQAPGPVALPTPAAAPARLAPIASHRFAFHVTFGQETHDKLEHARALLGHSVPSGDLTQVLDRALDALIDKLEKQKYAATTKPRGERRSADPRHIPAHVRRAVRDRDQDQCTFVSENGRRYDARSRLEYDHVVPVSRGGRATVEGVRLRCAAHNQLEADRTFGTTFMNAKRETARAAAQERARAADARASAAREQSRDVIAGLRQLGFRADEANRAAEAGEGLHGITLEERMRAALQWLRPPARSRFTNDTRAGAAP